MLNEKGAVDWTVGKLLGIILLIVVLVLVIYGYSNEQTHLSEQVGGFFDRVKGFFVSDSGSDIGDDGCLESFVESVPEVGDGALTLCEDYCKIDMSERFDVIDSGSFGLADGNFNYWKNSGWVDGNSLIFRGEVPEREREIYEALTNVYGEIYLRAILSGDDNSEIDFMGELADVIYIKVWGGGIIDPILFYAWDYYGWATRVGDFGTWERNTYGHIRMLQEIYAESDDYLIDDSVYVSIGDENSYVLVNDNDGEIDDERSYQKFRTWFFAEKDKILADREARMEALDELEESTSDIFVELGEESYNVEFAYDNGLTVIYFESPEGIYGIEQRGDSLILVEASGISTNTQWNPFYNSDFLRNGESGLGEFEDINKIYNYLRDRRC